MSRPRSSRVLRGGLLLLGVVAAASLAGACAQTPARPQLGVRVRTPGSPATPPAAADAAESAQAAAERTRVTGETPPPAPVTEPATDKGTLE